MTPGDLVWARRLSAASLSVSQGKQETKDTDLLSVSGFTSVCLEKWFAPLWYSSGNSEAQQTGLLVASWRSLVLATPQVSPGEEGDLR